MNYGQCVLVIEAGRRPAKMYLAFNCEQNVLVSEAETLFLWRLNPRVLGYYGKCVANKCKRFRFVFVI